jgi:hypothetical protein
VVAPKPDTSGLSDAVPKLSMSDVSSLTLADTLSLLDERLQLTLGLRQQRRSTSSTATAASATPPLDRPLVLRLAIEKALDEDYYVGRRIPVSYCSACPARCCCRPPWGF